MLVMGTQFPAYSYSRQWMEWSERRVAVTSTTLSMINTGRKVTAAEPNCAKRGVESRNRAMQLKVCTTSQEST